MCVFFVSEQVYYQSPKYRELIFVLPSSFVLIATLTNPNFNIVNLVFFRLRIIEWVLLESVIYLILWMWNDYIASILSLVFAAIFLAILIISLIAELLERSKVPKSYFWFIFVSFLVPVIVGVFYIWVFDGKLDWLMEF